MINLLIALPATLFAAQIGIYVFQRVTDQRYRRLLISLMFLSGGILLVREIFERDWTNI